MKTLVAGVLVVLSIAACGDNVPPTCEEVGCPESTFLACRGFEGPCECPQDDGTRIECVRKRALSKE